MVDPLPIQNNIYMGSGWWYAYPSEKYELVSWDHEIPYIVENNPNVPNHQPEMINGIFHCRDIT
jgi:hypothetical protein